MSTSPRSSFWRGSTRFAGGAVGDDALVDVITIARRLLQDNIIEPAAPGIVTYRGLRRTNGWMRPEDRLWVYSRGGSLVGVRDPDRVRKMGEEARVTYWCPSCQHRSVMR